MISTRIITEAIAIVGIYAAAIGLAMFGKPFQRGFFCDDQTIRYPLKMDQTIPFQLLLVITFVVPIFLNFIIENSGTWKPWTLPFWENFCRKSYVFLFGYPMMWFVTDVCKKTIGRLRPNFMLLCKPEPYWNQTNCLGHDNYITDYTCPGASGFFTSDVHQSFFSGHSSLSAFSFVYLALVLQRRVRGDQLRAIRVFMQAGLLILAMYIGYTRVSDYWHHWQDVVVGLLVGTTTAILLHTTLQKAVLTRSERNRSFTSVNGEAH